MFRLTLTLANGPVITETVRKMPRHWMSYLMQRAPYGTDYAGAVYTRTRLSDGASVSWPPRPDFGCCEADGPDVCSHGPYIAEIAPL